MSPEIRSPATEREHSLRLAVLVKGYPRLSETFIAQELLALERRGFSIDIWSLRRPTDGAVHALNRAVRAAPFYLPEYLYQEPGRVLRGFFHALRSPGFSRMFSIFLRDLLRDFTANRGRRLGQACVLARELSPDIPHLHVHYLHTPASVARYASMLVGRGFSFSAHAKDIWTTPDWEKREKIADAQWGVTCTRQGYDELARVAGAKDQARLALIYHGIAPERMPEAPASRPARDGSDPGNPVLLLSIGRLVAKKGFGTLLDAVRELPPQLNWRATIIGTGILRDELTRRAAALGIAEHVSFEGALAQDQVVAALRAADLFVLPCREGEEGDRDGLPNVILEAASQGLAILSTNYAAVPEFIEDGREGVLVAPDDPTALSAALAALIADPPRRAKLGKAAREKFMRSFSFENGIAAIARRLESSVKSAASASAPLVSLVPASLDGEGQGRRSNNALV
ncbi:MAG: glycosyltransferase family 4 protein [Hyphomicrobiales bacterium]|nr:glycosyltransferase family 4 protein [Hyphomicrobiales bacterium]